MIVELAQSLVMITIQVNRVTRLVPTYCSVPTCSTSVLTSDPITTDSLAMLCHPVRQYRDYYRQQRGDCSLAGNIVLAVAGAV